jgi:plasmid rolling circle replication initiator protein Rep
VSICSIPKNEIINNSYESEIITGTGEVLSDKKFNGQERPWAIHKPSSLKLHRLYKIARKIDRDCITDSAFVALEHCASFLLYKISRTGEKKLKNADFCRSRLCPMCNWRKSLKMFGQASRITERMLEKHPKTRFIFVTLTLKNCTDDELESTINNMNKGFTRLTAKGSKFGATAGFKTNMLGYMRAIEITYNSEKDTYHPHIHAIFAVKANYFDGRNYIKQADWQKMWQSCLELDYEPLVNVQSIKSTAEKGLVGAVAETAKYPVKIDGIIDLPQESAVPVIITLSKALRAKRLVTFGGLFADIRKELKLDDLESGDLIHADDSEQPVNEVAQMLFKFHVKVGCYVC